MVRAYQNRAANSLPERLLLEDTIQATIDAGLGGYALVEQWKRVKLQMDVASEGEKIASQDLTAIQQLENYLGAAERAFESELSQIETGAGVSPTMYPM